MWHRIGAWLARRRTAKAPPAAQGLHALCSDAGARARLYQALRRPAGIAVIRIGDRQFLFRHAGTQPPAATTARPAPAPVPVQVAAPEEIMRQIKNLEKMLAASRAGVLLPAEREAQSAAAPDAAGQLARIEQAMASVQAQDAWL